MHANQKWMPISSLSSLCHSQMKMDFSERENPGGGQVEPHRSKISSESEKEKTKLRERRRRSITSKILHGLRKHGNYDLPPRADINDVLRALANEAGWVVEADGTTYRRSKQQQASGGPCLSPLCHIYPVVGPLGSNNSFPSNFSTTVTSFNNIIPSVVSDPVEFRGGDCSTTASPHHLGGPSVGLLLTSSTFSSPFASPTSSEAISNLQVVNPFGLGVLSNGMMPLDSFGVKDDLPSPLLPVVDALDSQDWTTDRNLMGNPSSRLIRNASHSSILHQAQWWKSLSAMVPTVTFFNKTSHISFPKIVPILYMIVSGAHNKNRNLLL